MSGPSRPALPVNAAQGAAASLCPASIIRNYSWKTSHKARRSQAPGKRSSPGKTALMPHPPRRNVPQQGRPEREGTFFPQACRTPCMEKKVLPLCVCAAGHGSPPNGTETEGLFEGCMMPCHAKKLYPDKHGIYIHPRSDVSFLKHTAFSIAVHKKYMADVW